MWVWNVTIEDTGLYLFHAMLGNWNSTDFDPMIYKNDEPVILLYIFLLLANVVMLNLFIAVLSDIYSTFKYDSKVH
jgi:hypothetical protein